MMPPSPEFRRRRPRSAPLVSFAEERLVMVALAGLSFPAEKHDVLAYATDRGDVDVHIVTALDRLPDRTFSSSADVVVSIPEEEYAARSPGT